MSNVSWQKDMKDKAPTCFKDKIFHHGQLSKADLLGTSNGLFIIDEIDSGDKENQVLHTILKEAGVLDIKHMEEHNNRFIIISATMIKELYDVYQWGDLHELFKMTIPASYIGHKDFLALGIVKEFYSLGSQENAEKWVQEDIIDNYGRDFRIHLVRLTIKTINFVQNACIRKGVTFRNHTSVDRISEDDIKELFKEPLTRHIVLGIKGLFRRANLIPNRWKLRIGATHEHYTKVVDYNVQIQSFTGRMTGYWRSDIEAGHKTGPHRTSIKAIEAYEETYEDPFGPNSYHTNGYDKKKGKVTAKPTMLSPKNILNLEAVDLPPVMDEIVDVNLYRIYSDENVVREVCKILGYRFVSAKDNEDGFKETSLRAEKRVVSLVEAVNYVPKSQGGGGGGLQSRRYYPCYTDTTNNASLRFVVIIEPTIDAAKITECDTKYPSIAL